MRTCPLKYPKIGAGRRWEKLANGNQELPPVDFAKNITVGIFLG